MTLVVEYGQKSKALAFEFIWKPSESEHRDLMWTLFPEQAGFGPLYESNAPAIHPVSNITVPVGPALQTKLECFAMASDLPLSEVARRLLEMEVTLYGHFDLRAALSLVGDNCH